MKLIIRDTLEDAGDLLADRLVTVLRKNPALVLALSCGRTSLHAYQELVARYQEAGGFSFAKASVFSTDEYVGLTPGDRRSTRSMLNYHLFRQVDIPREQTHVPRGDATDLEAECKAYDLLIRARGGIDLAVLGLGHNGHVGLNEPGSTANSITRLVELTTSTIAAISGGERFRNLQNTPSKAIALGLGSILEAREVVLIATGLGKAEAVRRLCSGRTTLTVPASLLTTHKRLTIIVDRDAASRLDPDEAERLTTDP